MAVWEPPGKIGNNEQVGRRLYRQPTLRGAADQQPFEGLLFNDFQETRGDDVSLDRLGVGSIDRRVVNSYLISRARAAGAARATPRDFLGWASVRSGILAQPRQDIALVLVPSPVTDPEPLDNRYHCHVQRPRPLPPYFMALHLREIFQSSGSLHRISEAGASLETMNPDVTQFGLTILRVASRLRSKLLDAIGRRA